MFFVFNCLPFSKRQKCGDSKEINGCQVGGVRRVDLRMLIKKNRTDKITKYYLMGEKNLSVVK